jgi:autotransporter translocation and assembly factor TamB
VNLGRWLTNGPDSRLNFTVSGDVVADTTGGAEGALLARLAPSLFAGTVIDSGAAGMHFTGHQLLLDSLRLRQPGLFTTARGGLGLVAPARGVLNVDFDADSLSSLDSLASWITHSAPAAGSEHEGLRGSARGLLTLEGSLDSLAFEARVNGDNLQWRGWQVSAGRLHLEWASRAHSPFAVEGALDSLSHGRLGFGAASFAARGVTDSLTWFARSRLGDVGAFLAGGRYARRGDTTAVGIDSLAVLLPEGVWLLDAPTTLVVDDSAARLPGLALHSVAGTGKLTARVSLPAHGAGAANIQLEGFPLAGVYALLESDTTGVAGTVTATLGITGTRAAPLYTGSFSLSNGAIGAFRIPYLDGSVNYADRRLDAAAHLWREGRQILSVETHLPLDLALVSVAHRQIADTLAVRATGDSVDLSVLEAITPMLRAVSGTATLDVGIGGTWDAPRMQGRLAVANGAATLPTLGARYEGVDGRFTLSGDTLRVDTLNVRSDKGRAAVSGFVRLERLTSPVLGLAIRAQDFKALDIPDYLTLTATGYLTLTGPVFGATLRGNATVTSGVLHFADLLNKRVVNFDEPWAASLIDTSLARVISTQQLGPAFQNVFFDSLRIDNLQLQMGSDAWLRSTEANIQMTGGVTVSKRRAVYEVTGTLQAPRGTYRLVVPPLSREFLVTRGTVHYFGTPDLDAALDIEARHVVHPVASQSDQGDITIIARITGTLLVPRLTLEAERRDLSQTEIISYLLFGKPSFELSGGGGALGGQTSALKSAVANIVSGELERTLVSDLGVPLDYVEISPGDPADPLSGAQVEAGWQIGRKTFLVVNAGFCPNRPVAISNTLGASFQVRLSPEWRTEASFEPVRTCIDPLLQQSFGRQVGLDLFWERRY